MSDEDKLTQASARAVRAQQLLENELYVESYEILERQLIDGWINSPPRDVELREALFKTLHANRRQRELFAKVVSDGKLAQAEIKTLVETAERKKRFGLL